LISHEFYDFLDTSSDVKCFDEDKKKLMVFMDPFTYKPTKYKENNEKSSSIEDNKYAIKD
jgi:hypothetical protein